MTRHINRYPDTHSLADAAADRIVQILADAVEARGRASLVLTGGSTPRLTYRLLAERHRDALAWNQIDIFWGDDRFVPHDHPESNYGMAAEELLSRIQPGGVYPIPTEEASPDRAADAYDATLRAYFDGADPAFDLTLLGLGDDAHVASLFPGADELGESERLVVATQAPEGTPIHARVSMTFAALNASRHVLFIVAGAHKRAAVRRTFDHGDTPAAAIRPLENLTWLMDEEAAAQ